MSQAPSSRFVEALLVTVWFAVLVALPLERQNLEAADDFGDVVSDVQDLKYRCTYPSVADRDTQEAVPASDTLDGSATSSRPTYRTARQWLKLMDISESEIASFGDQQPLADNDGTLLKILYRLPQASLVDIQRWQTVRFQPEQCVRAPEEVRLRVFRISGRAVQVRRVELSERLSDLFGYDHYYQVKIALPQPDFELLVCTRVIPRAWLQTSSLDEPIGVSAMFLKVNLASADVTQLVMAAPRIAWFPAVENPQLSIGRDQILLGNLGMDIGLFDLVRSRDRRPINSRERECFYQLLASTGHAGDHLRDVAARPLDLAALLQTPGRERGQFIQFQGSLRRVTRVLVNEPDIRERFGISSYFQLDVLVPLGDLTIEVQGPAGDPAGPSYSNYFPVTGCVCQLPVSWQQMVDQDSINEQVVVSGFFYKLWSYPSEYVAKYDETQRQWSPMFMVSDVRLANAATISHESSAEWGLTLGVGFLAILVGIWIWIVRVERRDRAVSRKAWPEKLDVTENAPPEFRKD